MAGPWEAYQKAERPAAKPQANQYLETYTAIRNRLAAGEKTEQARRFALQRFDSDPRTAKLRALAGLAPVSTRQEEVRALARGNIEQLRQRRKKAGFNVNPREEAMAAGIRSILGIGPRIEQLKAYLTGGDSRRAFDVAKEENRLLREDYPAQGFAGEIVGSLLVGGGATALVRGGAAKLAPYAPKVANVLQNLTTLQKGQKLENAAKIAGAGAAGGAAQAVGEDSDVGTGTAYGAGGALAFGAGAKTLGWLGGKAADLFRVSGADRLLRRYTSLTADELAKRLADFRKTGKGEPTVFELLPLADRQKFRDVSKRMPGAVREEVSKLARERVQSIPGEVASAVKQATAPTQKAARNQVAFDLASSRGAEQPDLDEARLAIKAIRDPTEMDTVRSKEAKNIMRPHDDRRAFDGVSNLFPETIQLDEAGAPVTVNADPEASAIIRSAAGRLMMRDPEQGISVRDVTNLISRLGRMTTSSNAIEANNARNAVEHVMDALERDLPDILPDIQRMRGAWRNRTTMVEGMLEGTKGRTRTQTGFSGQDAKEVRKLYDTPEGTTGRGAGQRFQLTEDLGAATSPALGTVRNIAESDVTQRSLAGNLGREPAQQITEAAQTQSESARKLATAMVEQPDNMGDIEGGDLALLASALNPTSMAVTKARGLVAASKLLQGIPENRARTIVEMLFSRDPVNTQRAVQALKSLGDEGAQALNEISRTMAIGVVSVPVEISDAPVAEEEPPQIEEIDVPVDIVEEAGPWNNYASEAPYGRQVVESLFPGAEVTDDIRDPTSRLGRANSGSYHNSTENAVDVRPIPGITFEQFIQQIRDEGYEIIEARDEVTNPSAHATGPHWHVVLA